MFIVKDCPSTNTEVGKLQVGIKDIYLVKTPFGKGTSTVYSKEDIKNLLEKKVKTQGLKKAELYVIRKLESFKLCKEPLGLTEALSIKRKNKVSTERWSDFNYYQVKSFVEDLIETGSCIFYLVRD